MVNMMHGSSIVILAPHVDDELIGCFRQLSRGVVNDVFYFFDLDTERKIEAERTAQAFGFTPHFKFEEKLLDKNATLYVPNIADWHPDHKAVNYLAKSLPNPKRYYSVDMNTIFDLLSPAMQSFKKRMLLELYPSQEKLLGSNDKYFLFESDLPFDIRCTKTEGYVTIQCDPTNLEDIREIEQLAVKYPGRYIKTTKENITYEFIP